MSDPEGSSIKWSTFMCTEAAVYEQTTRKETCSWLQSRVCGLMEKPNGLLFFILVYFAEMKTCTLVGYR